MTPPAEAAKYDLDQNNPVFPACKISGYLDLIMREETVFNAFTMEETDRLGGYASNKCT